MSNNKEKFIPIFLFIFCALLTLVLFPVCWAIALQEKNINEQLKNILIYIPFIPISIFFIIWIYKIIKNDIL